MTTKYPRSCTFGDIFLKGIDKIKNILYNISIKGYVNLHKFHANTKFPRLPPREFCFARFFCADCQAISCPATCKGSVKLPPLRQIPKKTGLCKSQASPPSVPDYSAFRKLTTVLLYHRKKCLSNFDPHSQKEGDFLCDF